MKRILYTYLLICSAISVFSQAPGYMGKRFVAGYGIYANPRLSVSGGNPGINLSHEAYLEFAMKRSISVGLSARFYRAMYTNVMNVSTRDPYVSLLDQSPNGFYNIKGRNYALHFKFYKRNFVAPWGKYVLLGATLNTLHTHYDPGTMYVTAQDRRAGEIVYLDNFGPQDQSYMRFDVLFGNGRNRVIADRITIDYGYVFHVLGMSAAVFDASDVLIFEGGIPSMASYIESTAAARSRAINKFNLYLKVGVLLF